MNRSCLATVLLWTAFSIWHSGTSTVHAQATASTAERTDDDAFFETKVRPILVERCLACHSSEQQKGGLRLDSAEAVRKGGDAGQILDVEVPSQSRLLEVLSYADSVRMPPTAKLADAELAALTQWVLRGAPFPQSVSLTPLHAPGSPEGIAEARKSHWSLQPVVLPAVPDGTWPEWEQTPIDRFITRRLADGGIAPSAPASRAVLLRRVKFDLLGLPATAEEIEDFVGDSAPDAWSRVVDRLLASPRYGERWGRHWLDVARYADTKGYVFTEERKYPFAYTYRDYVIHALNSDLPYDQFLLEQIAADQLELQGRREPLAALGFLTLGRRFGNNQNDIIDDRIDVVTRGLMGLAVQCARCHDHKYDPVPTADYYSLYGIFASCVEPGDLPQIGDPVDGEPYRAYVAELEKRERVVQDFLQSKRVEVLNQLRGQTLDYLVAAAKKEGQSLPDGIGVSLGPNDLRPEMVTRWKNFIASTAREHHAVFAPWHALAALPEAGFASQAEPLLAALQVEPPLDAPRLNLLVRKTLAELKPKSLVEVAAAYGRLFTDVQKQWLESQTPATQAASPEPQPDGARTRNSAAAVPPALPAALADPAAEELRQVLYSEQGPLGVPRDELRRLFDRATRNKLTEFRRAVESWKANSVAAPPRAMVLNDAPQPVAARILIRGNPGRPGDEVPRRFLQVLSEPGSPRFERGSGRLELAQAVASPLNPLTARVMVNRVWMHHFGKGLVATPGDFGRRGMPPTHPELLDYLAGTLMADGWSIKMLHRRILNSAVYQQASDERDEALAVDPENRLWWKANRRRIEFEGLRDGLLAVAGRLDDAMGGRPVDLFLQPYSGRRTIYGFIDRQDLPGTFRTFDFASPDVSTPQRPQTTVPQQALYGMNSPFVIEQARGVAARVLAAAQLGAAGDPAKQLLEYPKEAYRIVLGRLPDPWEADAAARFLTESSPAGAEVSPEAGGPGSLVRLEQLAQALLLSNEFVFVD